MKRALRRTEKLAVKSEKGTEIRIRESDGPLEIREVRCQADLDQFIQMQWQIYKDDPHWIPPLII